MVSLTHQQFCVVLSTIKHRLYHTSLDESDGNYLMDLKIQTQIMESDSPEATSWQWNHCKGCTEKPCSVFMMLQRHLLFSLALRLLRFSIFKSDGRMRETRCQ